MRTLTPTRPVHSHTGANWGIEPSPRHSQCRVLPLHQDRHHVIASSGRGGSRTLAARFIARPRLANACDKPAFASLPSRSAVGSGRSAVRQLHYCRLPTAYRRLLHAPARNRTWISSFARSRGVHSTTGTPIVFPSAYRLPPTAYRLPPTLLRCPRQDSNPERSVRSAA